MAVPTSENDVGFGRVVDLIHREVKARRFSYRNAMADGSVV